MRYLILLYFLSLAGAQSLDEPALRISTEIRVRHLPFGSIVDPIYAGPDSNEITGYTRCGDSAIWTGHYLAAESFRYSATRAAEALDAARNALAAIERMVDVTGPLNLLSRCAVPAASPYASGIVIEEKSNGVYNTSLDGENWYWIGNTSRDQYLGVLFGLSTAYERLDDSAIRRSISDLVTRLVDRLLEQGWSVRMPDGSLSTTFSLRPEQQLSILQVGRQVNPERFASIYANQGTGVFGLGAAIAYERLDPYSSYYKWNLAAISFYNLIRLEPRDSPRIPTYWNTYELYRETVASHGNSHFNMIDRVLRGPEGKRDAETLALLNEWLRWPRRDFFVDLRGKVPVCGDRACSVIPVRDRVPTDFLWQRSPFQLFGGGSGRVESAGIDFILPYWMARVYGVSSPVAIVSAASGATGIAPGSIASLYAPQITAGEQRVQLRDSAGRTHDLRIFSITPGQINALIPEDAAIGPATVSITGGTALTGTVEVQRVAPAIFTVSMNGTGPAAVTWSGRYLSLYATGVRGRSSLAAVTAHIGNRTAPVLYAGPQPEYQGLDQVNLEITGDLRGMGETDVILVVDGVRSNAARIRID